MITLLDQSTRRAVGFKVNEVLTAEDVAMFSKRVEETIHSARMPIGLLVDLSEMHGTTWAARWQEMRFLQKHADHIARIAIICNDEWQELSEMILVAAAFMQAETVYCDVSQLHHAWHWVKMNPFDEGAPLRILYPGRGLFQDYTPEYIGL
jgi:hypothetical protein